MTVDQVSAVPYRRPAAAAAVAKCPLRARADVYCRELARDCAKGFADHATGGPVAVLIGPEGGFTGEERNMLAQLPVTSRISLGERILRAETAVVASLTLLHNSRRRTRAIKRRIGPDDRNERSKFQE